MSRKKTILILSEHYLPGTKTGGPVRSIANLVDWLGDGFEFRILTSNHDKWDHAPYPGIAPSIWYPVGKAQVRYLFPHESGLFRLGAIIRNIPHDLLQVESILAQTSIQAMILRRLGQLRGRILITPRGHLGQGALQQKSTKKMLFLRLVRLLGLYRGLYWHATSQGEREEIIRYFGAQEAVRIHVAPNLPLWSPQALESAQPEKRPGSLRMLFISRISRKKNLHFALETLQGLHGEIQFDIYGPIEDKAYWDECQTIIARLPPHIRVQYCGVVPFDRTVQVLAGYHLFYLPTLHENYGHVILEALSAGCPVLISDQTPWKDVETYGSGWALPLNHRAGFVERIESIAASDETEWLRYSAAARVHAEQHVKESGIVEYTARMFHMLTDAPLSIATTQPR